MPRDHHAIFVEKENNARGTISQVTGSILQGMMFETKKGKRPEDSDTAPFISKTLTGTVSSEKYPEIATVCASLPPPHKQYNGIKKINPSEPVRICQEWTADAVKALKDAQVVIPKE
jgi:hypothetical protein